MTVPWTVFDDAARTDPNAPALRRQINRRARNLALVALVAMIIASWILYERPSDTYQVGSHSAIWSLDVKTALAEKRSPTSGSVALVGQLVNLPGVGKIVQVVVDKFPLHKGEAVLFLTGVGANYGGLAYLNGYPPPSDSCSFHLSGLWWQIAPVNVTTMGCARGFRFTGV
jgi:hypothetical protein